MLRLLPFFALFLTLISQVSWGQVTIDADGNVALGSTVTVSSQRVRILPTLTDNSITGLYIGSPLSGASRFGIQAFALGGSAGSTAIFARANSGGNNVYGVRGEANNGINGFGIFGFATGSSNINYAGYFNGDVVVTGTFSNPSDAKLKERSQPLVQADVLSRLIQLTPKSYYYRPSPEYAHMRLPSTLQYGLIAQEVEAIFPELIRDEVQPPPLDEEGQEVGTSINFKSVDYMKLIPLLLAAIQEQQRRIETLEAALQQ